MSFGIIFLGEPMSLCESGTWVTRVEGWVYEGGRWTESHGSSARVEGSLYNRHPSSSASSSEDNRTQLAQGLNSYNSKFLEFMVTVEVVATDQPYTLKSSPLSSIYPLIQPQTPSRIPRTYLLRGHNLRGGNWDQHRWSGDVAKVLKACGGTGHVGSCRVSSG